MSERFYGKLKHFFSLLDTNHNGTIEREEASRQLQAILRDPSTHLESTPPQDAHFDEDVERDTEKKVNELFKSADENHDAHITYESFQAMYSKLLKHDHYEPEVLELDLDRAINALEKKALES